MSKINVIVEDSASQETETPTTNPSDSTNPTDSIDQSTEDNTEASSATTGEGHISVPDTGAYNSQNPGNDGVFSASGLAIIFILIVSCILFIFRKQILRIIKNNKDFHIQPSRKTISIIGAAPILLVVASVFYAGLDHSPMSAMAGEVLPLSVSGDVEIKAKPSGESTFAVGQHTVEVISQAKYGYTLYAYPSSANLSSEENQDQFISGIEPSDDTSVLSHNNWGIATIRPTDSNSQVWWSMSNTENKPFVVKVTSSANDNTTQVYYGINISEDLPKGTYTGTVEYVAVANSGPEDSSEYDPVDFPDPLSPTNPEDNDDNDGNEGQSGSEVSTFALSFNANQGTKAPTRQNCATAASETSCQITISSSSPTRSGYAFLGWAESATATSSQYQPGDTITLTANKTLYAVWERRVNIFTAVENGGGTVSGAASNIPAGSTHVITFSPNSGYQIEYVTVNNTATTVTNNTLNLTVGDEDVYVVVSYQPIEEEPIEPSAYQLSFNANKGSGAPNSLQCTPSTTGGNCSVTIPNTLPTRDNYYFLGWATSSSASSAAKKPGDSVSLSANAKLYAIWAPIYKLSLNANGGSSSASGVSECHPTTTQGKCTLTIPSNSTPSYKNHSFLGWATSSDATTASLQPGNSLEVSKNTTLYAVWHDETIAVHFVNLGTNGNATLLENKGHYALVDTGKSGSYSKLSNYLDSLGVKKLDFVILSHPHLDHNGGMTKLLDQYEVGTIYEKTYTGKDADASETGNNRYKAITDAAKAKGVPIVYVDKDSKFTEAPGKSGSVYLNSSMRIHFFNTTQRIGHVKQSGEEFDYFTSDYWEDKSENVNSIVNLIRVNDHNVLLTGDVNNYNILNYIMTEKVDVAYKNGQTLDVYSIPHHANYNCTGNQKMGITASYFLATNNVDSKFDDGSYRITNNTVKNGQYNSCFKWMGRNYRSAFYSANDKDNSKATVFDLSGSSVERPAGGYEGWQLSERGPND